MPYYQNRKVSVAADAREVVVLDAVTRLRAAVEAPLHTYALKDWPVEAQAKAAADAQVAHDIEVDKQLEALSLAICQLGVDVAVKRSGK